jgi:hypothetical protein
VSGKGIRSREHYEINDKLKARKEKSKHPNIHSVLVLWYHYFESIQSPALSSPALNTLPTPSQTIADSITLLDMSGVSSTMPSAPPVTPARVGSTPAGEAADDDVEDGEDAVDDGEEDGRDGV